MLAAAAAHAVPGRVEFALGDVRDWQPPGPVDVLVSNAVLHWVPGHEELLARWAGQLAPGGELAVQVPATSAPPPTPCWPSSAGRPRWAAQLADAAPAPDAVLEPAGYYDVLTAAGLDRRRLGDDLPARAHRPGPGARLGAQHQLRPVLAQLGDDDGAEFTAAYAAALREAYPPRPDGTTLLPFRRIFAVGSRPS